MDVSSLPTGKYTLGGMRVKVLRGDRKKTNRMLEVMGNYSLITEVMKVEGGFEISCVLTTRGGKKKSDKKFKGIIIPAKSDC
jgi:hypothetical protein